MCPTSRARKGTVPLCMAPSALASVLPVWEGALGKSLRGVEEMHALGARPLPELGLGQMFLRHPVVALALGPKVGPVLTVLVLETLRARDSVRDSILAQLCLNTNTCVTKLVL